MKIVFIDTTIDESLIGGGHTYLPKLLKGLKLKGHEMYLVTKEKPNDKVYDSIIESGVILHSNLINKYVLVQEAALSLAQWVNQLEPDIYVISASGDAGWLALPHIQANIATLTIGHTDSDNFYQPAKHYYSFLTGAVGVSDVVCSNYHKVCHINEEQIFWIPYGVKALAKLSDIGNVSKLNLIYVGRIEEEQKRIFDIIALIKRLELANIPFTFKIIGDGPEMPKLKKELDKLIEEGKVIVFGWLSEEKVIKHLRESSIFILMSQYEGFCIALIEAMANGCLPIVTNIDSGNAQLIKEGQNGFLIDIGNVDAFVDRIKWIYQNPQFLYTFRESALSEGSKYSEQNMVLNYEDTFKKLIVLSQSVNRKPDEHFPIMPSCVSIYPDWLRKINLRLKQLQA